MKSTIIVVTAVMALTACGKGIYDEGDVAYEYVGCHQVIHNPADTGERAFLGFADLKKGDYVFYKRVDNNGETGPVVTATSC